MTRAGSRKHGDHQEQRAPVDEGDSGEGIGGGYFEVPLASASRRARAATRSKLQ